MSPKGSGQEFGSLGRDKREAVLGRLRGNQWLSKTGGNQWLLEQAEKDLSDCNKKIMQLKLSLIGLEYQQTQLGRVIEEYQSLFLSPIRRLPPDILSCIFDFCCPFNQLAHWEKDPHFQPYQPAFRISAVCAHWRSLAIAFWPIWSHMAFGPLGISNTRYHLSQVKLCIERSGTFPLHIDMLGPSAYLPHNIMKDLDRSVDAHTMTLLKCLIAESSRWQDLRIRTHVNYLASIVAAPFWKGYSPALEYFALSLEGVERSHSGITVFKNSPNLATLHLRSSLWSSFPVTIPSHQLSYIHIRSGIAPGDLIDMIERCPNAVSVHCSELNGPVAPQHLSTWHKVQHLKVKDHNGALRRLLPVLRLPHIQSVWLRQDFADDLTCSLPELEHFITQNVPANRLSELVLVSVKLTEEQLIRILGVLSGLALLVVDHPCQGSEGPLFTNRLLQQMNPYAVVAGLLVLVPRLCSLTIAQARTSFRGDVLVETVVSRWSSSVTQSFRQIKVFVPEETFQAGALARLDDLKAAGLSFYADLYLKKDIDQACAFLD